MGYSIPRNNPQAPLPANRIFHPFPHIHTTPPPTAVHHQVQAVRLGQQVIDVEVAPPWQQAPGRHTAVGVMDVGMETGTAPARGSVPSVTAVGLQPQLETEGINAAVRCWADAAATYNPHLGPQCPPGTAQEGGLQAARTSPAFRSPQLEQETRPMTNCSRCPSAAVLVAPTGERCLSQAKR